MGRLSELAPDEAAVIRGTSAGEAVAIRRVLEEQRECIASEVEALGCSTVFCSMGPGVVYKHNDYCPKAVAAMIRAGKD